MIDKNVQNQILGTTTAFWIEEVDSPGFRAIYGGKEIGHRIADYVDEKTSHLLMSTISTGYQRNKTGKTNARSMGDIWVQSAGIYHPLNVKAGEFGKDGQPNLVALNKVLRALLNRQIDCYYLLIIKIEVLNTTHKQETETLVPRIYLVDMLDHLDVVTFDSGPGQIMLKEKFFYQKMSLGAVPSTLSLEQKISSLIDLKQDGDRRLFENRKKSAEKLRRLASKYESEIGRSLDQGELNIG